MRGPIDTEANEPDLAAERHDLGHFARIPTEAALDPDISLNELRILALYAAHADRGGKCFPGLRRIGKMAGLSARGALKIYRRLEKRGYLRQTGKMPTSNNPNHAWGLITQIIYKRSDGMTPDDQITKQPGRDRNDPPLEEPKAEEIEKPAKPKPEPRKFYKPALMAVETGPHTPPRSGAGGGKFLDFDVF